MLKSVHTTLDSQAKRVLQIVGRMNRGGAETMVMNLYREIDRSRLQFDFLYFTEEECHFDAEILELGGRIHRVPVSLSRRPRQLAAAISRIQKANSNLVAVQSHMNFAIGQHLKAAHIAGIPLRIAHAHSTNDTSKNPRNLIRSLYRYRSRKRIKAYATDRIACGTEAGNYLFGDKSSFRVLPNSVDLDRFDETRNTSSDPWSTYNSQSVLRLLQVGSLATWKNQHHTLQVCQELLARGVPFLAVLIGQGPDAALLKTEIERLKLQDCVILAGVRADIDLWMRYADVLLMPSLIEGFPVVLVESQASGLQAVISDQISAEVDLGLEVIKRLPLKEVSPWTETILQVAKRPRPDIQLRRRILSENGFDAKRNAADYLAWIESRL